MVECLFVWRDRKQVLKLELNGKQAIGLIILNTMDSDRFVVCKDKRTDTKSP